MLPKQIKRHRIHRKIRAKIFGTKERPRLCVFKSANHIYAQLIDDESGKVLASASDLKFHPVKSAKGGVAPKAQQFDGVKTKKVKKVSNSVQVGKLIAKQAMAKKIKKVVFDRGGFIFHGRVKAVAEGAREGGLEF